VELGPGIAVCTIGSAGSSGKKGCSLLSEATAAAAEAYCRRRAIGATLAAGRAIDRERAGCARRAVRRKDAIVKSGEGGG
jgi:hypothetical protein